MTPGQEQRCAHPRCGQLKSNVYHIPDFKYFSHRFVPPSPPVEKCDQSDTEIIIEELNKMASEFHAQGSLSLDGRVKELEGSLTEAAKQYVSLSLRHNDLKAEVEGLVGLIKELSECDRPEPHKTNMEFRTLRAKARDLMETLSARKDVTNG
jgi:hypothetical protein